MLLKFLWDSNIILNYKLDGRVTLTFTIPSSFLIEKMEILF